jgi:hypothetical protein
MSAARIAALALAIAATVLCVAGGGIPRLIGTGCEDRPLGIALAIEESDYSTQCRNIRPIWSIES